MSTKVKKGQITFDAEGNDAETSKYFSRVIHWPGNALSGVTIGRGYDMGNRTKIVVKQDMTKAGIPSNTAKALSEGAGLKGAKAKEFAEKHKKTIGKITHAQQVKLFDNIYPNYESRAKQNYDKWTATEKSRVEWNKLDQAIRDVLVDFVYQGFTKGPNPMKAGMNNDFDELIKYINETAAIKQYEPGRNRVKYLKSRKPVKNSGANK
ncbi:MAG: pesticin C-terminus-like muramidase [Gammaproteobacteria bacterium]|nr:pesticin C-terminus-like muramidase [Gammaproteobacteria bacterium]MCF6261362.1 pesticin C-terminus-like muramidase [Gammaproteobacteria bacterium]